MTVSVHLCLQHDGHETVSCAFVSNSWDLLRHTVWSSVYHMTEKLWNLTNVKKTTLSTVRVRPLNRRAHSVSKLVVRWMANSNSFTSMSDTRFAINRLSSFLHTRHRTAHKHVSQHSLHQHYPWFKEKLDCCNSAVQWVPLSFAKTIV